MIQKIDLTTSEVPSECYVTHLFPQRLKVLVEDLYESHYALPTGLQRAVLRFTPLSLLGLVLRIFLLGPTNGSVSVIFGIFLPGMIEVITVCKLYPQSKDPFKAEGNISDY